MSRTDAILKRLLALHPKLIDLELTRIMRLLDALGRPQDQMPPVIHVAGTNGKGSTIAYMRAMLEAAGQEVHVYTSPHLVAFRERIRLNGAFVSTKALNAALEACEVANGSAPITYFEITTAAAILLFAQTRADYLLLETGLGGTYDATNVVDAPLGTVITPIALDHVEFLGPTLSDIAHAKAGIMKQGCPAVVARQEPEALAVIEERARTLGVAPFVAGQGFDGYAQNGRLVYQDEAGLIDLPLPALHGHHQLDNAALAVATLRRLRLPVDETAMQKGMRQVSWPARMTALRQGALTGYIAEGQELWLDGGHNASGARAIATTLKDMARARPAPLVMIAGMMATKDARQFFAPFSGLAPRVFTVPIPGEATALSARALASFAKGQGYETEICRGLTTALQKAAHIEGARILICGSLYLAGHALKQNRTPPY